MNRLASRFIWPTKALGVIGCGLLGIQLLSAAEPVPLIHAHAHNDYLHARPLLDALDHGFCSVEADIFLVEGKLLVAHSRSQLHPDRTLEKLYLEPLQTRIRQNGGKVFRNGPEVTLLIDLKTDWTNTYPALRAALAKYADILTTYSDGRTRSNAVAVLLTGNRSPQMFAGETLRLAALDGDLADLDSTQPASLIAWISSNWTRSFKWRGTGEMPAEELAQLKSIVAKAHQQGRRVRFWGAPDTPLFWRTLRHAGVDLINTDDLAGLESFLRKE